ncbi:hypothetical protein K239x_55260 [Planctomycetes bacterium K23_9]|uniref:Uncharacterized protein n=1 Tax=Stieleria marina TaxID=1930275 RepID=A0A517P2A2_9BACT|nr:hypothetical protein K239x_55260 [Planctomycetes bacterium K23_9]
MYLPMPLTCTLCRVVSVEIVRYIGRKWVPMSDSGQSLWVGSADNSSDIQFAALSLPWITDHEIRRNTPKIACRPRLSNECPSDSNPCRKDHHYGRRAEFGPWIGAAVQPALRCLIKDRRLWKGNRKRQSGQSRRPAWRPDRLIPNRLLKCKPLVFQAI